MNLQSTTSEIITANLVNRNQHWPFWKRLVSGLIAMLGLGAAGGCFWIFGMLMFTFSLDGASSSDIPSWVEPFMLVGWAPLVALAALAPPTCFICGVSLKRCVVLLAALLTVAVVSPLVAWIVTIAAVSS